MSMNESTTMNASNEKQQRTNSKIKNDSRFWIPRMTQMKKDPPSMMEKVVAMAFPELINCVSSDNSSSNNSNGGNHNDSNDNSSTSSQGSFLSLFNGSTYHLDEYFTSIGFDGTLVANDCPSTVSMLSGDSGIIYHDVESIYTSSSSSSSSSSLDGLHIPTENLTCNHENETQNEMSGTGITLSNEMVNINTVTAINDTPSDEYLSPSKVIVITTTSKPSSCCLALLEKLLVIMTIAAILTGCVITTLTILRHFHTKAQGPLPVQASITLTNRTANSPTIDTNDTRISEERLNIIRDWLGDNFHAGPGTPQYDALTWMAYVDIPSILGDDIQKRVPTSVTNQTEQEEAIVFNTIVSNRITQRYVLLLLFFNNIGNENLMLGGWASMSGARLTECIWPGITCRAININQTHHNSLSVITGIELNPSIANVYGSIPTEIGLLSHLESLILTDNSLTGDIPTIIYSMRNLYMLRISNTTLTTSLSTDFGQLTNMKFLDLSHNDLKGTVPTQLGQLTDLYYLNLGENNFSGTIPTEFGAFQLLEKLSLENNAFCGTMPKTVCALQTSNQLQALSADCVSPLSSCTMTRVICDCCTLCF